MYRGDIKKMNDKDKTKEQLISELNEIKFFKYVIDQLPDAAEALLAGKRQYLKLFSENIAGNYIAGKDGKIQLANPALAEMLGFESIDELKAVNAASFYPSMQEREKFVNLIKEKGKLELYQQEFIRRDGQRIVVLENAVGEFDADGKLMYILGFIINITERKKLENEMDRLDRLNLVGEMAANIGHEVRNPMTTVRGFLQILSKKNDCAHYKDYFDLMIKELDIANSIITQFINLAKNKPVYRVMQNLNTIIQTLYPLILGEAYKSEIYINKKLHPIPDLLLDDKEIKQLILNLVCNGIEAMSPGGSLTLSTYTDDKEVVLAVHDHGSGIKQAALDKLGTPFVTTKENGTGVGLAVCYSIVNRHKARIEVETSPSGTTFLVRFKRQQIAART